MHNIQQNMTGLSLTYYTLEQFFCTGWRGRERKRGGEGGGGKGTRVRAILGSTCRDLIKLCAMIPLFMLSRDANGEGRREGEGGGKGKDKISKYLNK